MHAHEREKESARKKGRARARTREGEGARAREGESERVFGVRGSRLSLTQASLLRRPLSLVWSAWFSPLKTLVGMRVGAVAVTLLVRRLTCTSRLF